MRILVIAPQPFFAIRGTPLAIRELVSVLSEYGCSVDILTFHLGEDINFPGLRIYRNKLLSGLIKSVPPGFSFKKLILDKIIFTKALFLILVNNYDVVHCVEESAYFIAWIRWLKPFLFTYDMDSSIPAQLQDSQAWFFAGLARRLERFAISRSSCVVTISPVFTERIKKSFPDKQVFQIEDTSPQDEIPSVEKGDGRKVILYTGNFEKYQGVELLIEAFCRICDNWPDVDLVLAGGEEKDICGLRERYKKQVIFTGKRPVSDMPRFLGAASILVSPRIKGENTPFKIYSYLASGKPILATDIISHSQVLVNGKSALLAAPTVEGLKNGLERLLKDSKLADLLGEGGRRLFEERYTRRCYEGKVKDYLDFLGRHKSAALDYGD